MEGEAEQRPREEATEDWVMLRREDFEHLVEQLEALADVAPVAAAPDADVAPGSPDHVLMDVDLAA
jgi:hypothetical protein